MTRAAFPGRGSLLAFLLFSALATPAAAEDWRDALAAGDRALAERKAEAAVPLYRKALDGAEGRLRVRAYHGLASALLQQGDLAGAARAIEEARALIALRFGADDLAMAGNRQLQAMVLLRRGERDAARDALAQAARIRNAKVDVWDTREGLLGPVTHKPSGVVVPHRAGALVQFRRDVNDDDGSDVSIGYRANGRAGGVSITLIIYRPQGTFETIFADEVAAIRSFNRQAIPRKTAPAVVETKSGKIEGRMAPFEYLVSGGAVGTRLYLLPLKRDYVKLRVTYRLEDESFAESQIAALLAGIGWP